MTSIISSLLFPQKCPYCGRLIEFSPRERLTECKTCRSQYPLAPRTIILPDGEKCVSPFTYRSTVRTAVTNYKFHGQKSNSESFSKAIVNAVISVGMDPDIITCVPLSESTFKERGYNQSEVIARRVSRLMNRPFLHTLKKIKNNLIQHELSEAERRDNVLGVYGVLNSELFAEKKLLLIDDICTTGSTLSECCRVLRNAGAAKTECAVIASAGENDVKISEGEDNDEEFDVFLE